MFDVFSPYQQDLENSLEEIYIYKSLSDRYN